MQLCVFAQLNSGARATWNYDTRCLVNSVSVQIPLVYILHIRRMKMRYRFFSMSTEYYAKCDSPTSSGTNIIME